jgi:hypothetical protein
MVRPKDADIYRACHEAGIEPQNLEAINLVTLLIQLWHATGFSDDLTSETAYQAALAGSSLEHTLGNENHPAWLALAEYKLIFEFIPKPEIIDQVATRLQLEADELAIFKALINLFHHTDIEISLQLLSEKIPLIPAEEERYSIYGWREMLSEKIWLAFQHYDIYYHGDDTRVLEAEDLAEIDLLAETYSLTPHERNQLTTIIRLYGGVSGSSHELSSHLIAELTRQPNKVLQALKEFSPQLAVNFETVD